MRYLAIAAAIFLGGPAFAEQSELFHDAHACPERGVKSACIFGKIPGGTKLTLITRGWKASAEARETFPNNDFDNGHKTITRLESSGKPPTGTIMIAVAAPTDSIEVIATLEIHDENISRRAAEFVSRMKGLEGKNGWGYKYEIQTRIFKLSPAITIAEARFTSHIETADPDTKEKLIVGEHLDDDTVPLLVGSNMLDLFASTRKGDETFCGGIVAAFKMSGRMHLLSNAEVCETDLPSTTLVHDLSGKVPKLVFQSW
ncbi:MAG: hypothetical protein JO141_18525 [Bradyrhizobium sp.]|nr:hypothetical protein [Bradyrhizobium sp.]